MKNRTLTRGLVRAVATSAMLAVLAGAAPGPVLADGVRPLPPFTVVSATGQDVSASHLTTEARWVLICVKPGATATSRLLAALASWQLPPATMNSLVFVVEGSVERASAYLASQPDPRASGLVWYADPDGRAARALGVTGALTLQGIRDGAIDWTVAGVLNDPAAFESVLRTWIGAPSAVR